MTFRFHHIGVAVEDHQKASDVVSALLGYKIIKGPIDDPLQRVSVCFLGSGSAQDLIELVAPRPADESTACPISAFLKRRIGGYHICYEVDGLEQAIQEARKLGCVPIGAPVPASAFEGRRIAWMLLPGSLLLELLEAESATT